MKLKSAKAFVQEVAIILIGCFLTAFAVDCILKPSGLAVTGVTGVAMVLEHWFGINYTYTNYLFTLMIAVATYFLLGKKEFFRILALSIIYPVILVIFNHFSFQLIYDDLPLTCITFSLFYGTGIGMILRLGYSFGGSDTLAKILSVKSRGRISIGQAILLLDGSVILLSAFVLDRKAILYMLICQVLYVRVMERAMMGFQGSLYQVEIISSQSCEILSFILHQLNRGATLQKIQGGYSATEFSKITCICSAKEFVRLRNHVGDTDSQAFLYSTTIYGVWGHGRGFHSFWDTM